MKQGFRREPWLPFFMEVNMNELLEEIVGLNMVKASRLVRERGFLFRVMNKNGEYLSGSNDFVDKRINVRVDDNEVTEVLKIG